MTTYLLKSPDTNAIIREAAKRMIDSLRLAEQKLNRQVSNVQIEFPSDTGETFALTLTRISSSEGMQASGGVQSGGSFASPGTVPAATNTEPITEMPTTAVTPPAVETKTVTRTLRTTKRAIS